MSPFLNQKSMNGKIDGIWSNEANMNLELTMSGRKMSSDKFELPQVKPIYRLTKINTGKEYYYLT
jgi:hypothetical protein